MRKWPRKINWSSLGGQVTVRSPFCGFIKSVCMGYFHNKCRFYIWRIAMCVNKREEGWIVNDCSHCVELIHLVQPDESVMNLDIAWACRNDGSMLLPRSCACRAHSGICISLSKGAEGEGIVIRKFWETSKWLLKLVASFFLINFGCLCP